MTDYSGAKFQLISLRIVKIHGVGNFTPPPPPPPPE